MDEFVETKWMGNMTFEATIDGFPVRMDATPEHGGTGFGPRPKPIVLSSLAGCTGMDVVSILAKKRISYTEFKILILAEMTESHPKYYHKIHLTYQFTGENFEGNQELFEKISRSIELSSDNYCGVTAMLRKSCDISWELQLQNS
ncbi:MAG: OsmC family peroxiredoxin [Bacteroidetes bacterium]|nr:MAG: OsmC family peroxiredoxin [Bacteroidota bacterium]